SLRPCDADTSLINNVLTDLTAGYPLSVQRLIDLSNRSSAGVSSPQIIWIWPAYQSVIGYWYRFTASSPNITASFSSANAWSGKPRYHRAVPLHTRARPLAPTLSREATSAAARKNCSALRNSPISKATRPISWFASAGEEERVAPQRSSPGLRLPRISSYKSCDISDARCSFAHAT